MSREGIRREKQKVLNVSRVLQIKLQEYMNFADKIGADEIISDSQINGLKNSKKGFMLEVAELNAALSEIIAISERT